MAQNAAPSTYTMATDKPDGRHGQTSTQELSPLLQSRETGGSMPEARRDAQIQPVKALPFAKSWHHMIAGA